MKVGRAQATQANAAPLPPPPDDQYGVVPWDPPPEAPPPPRPPQRAAWAAPSVTLAGVRLSGRTAGFVDSAYDLGRTLRDHPVTSVAMIAAGVAVGVVAPAAVLGVTVALVVGGVAATLYHEQRAANAKDPVERERQRFASGEAMFFAVSSVPLRGLRGLALGR